MWNNAVEVFTDAIDATDPGTALEHNLYTRHPDSLDRGEWGAGRVTLVGDAAHPLRPTGNALSQTYTHSVGGHLYIRGNMQLHV